MPPRRLLAAQLLTAPSLFLPSPSPRLSPAAGRSHRTGSLRAALGRTPGLRAAVERTPALRRAAEKPAGAATGELGGSRRRWQSGGQPGDREAEAGGFQALIPFSKDGSWRSPATARPAWQRLNCGPPFSVNHRTEGGTD